MVCEKDVRWILDGQNLPAITKALDVPYRTLWGWINESEEKRKRYEEALEEQDEMIRMKVDEVLDSLGQFVTPVVSEDYKF